MVQVHEQHRANANRSQNSWARWISRELCYSKYLNLDSEIYSCNGLRTRFEELSGNGLILGFWNLKEHGRPVGNSEMYFLPQVMDTFVARESGTRRL